MAVGVGILLPLAAVLIENILLPGVDDLRWATLTADMVEQFERDGFLVLRNVVPHVMIRSTLAELHAIQAAAESNVAVDDAGEAWDNTSSGANQSHCTFAFERDADGNLLQPPRLHKAQGIALKAPSVLKLMRHSPLAIAAATLVWRGVSHNDSKGQSEVDVFGTKYFPVPSGSPGSMSWHDDNYYFGTTRSNTISCVIYLRHVDVRSGCLRVLPGSHRDVAVGSQRAHLYELVKQQHGEYIAETSIVRGDLALSDDGSRRAPMNVALTAGSAVLFDANLLHSAHANLRVRDGGQTASERVAFHFIPGDLDIGFRGTSFGRGLFADRHLAMHADGSVPNIRTMPFSTLYAKS